MCGVALETRYNFRIWCHITATLATRLAFSSVLMMVVCGQHSYTSVYYLRQSKSKCNQNRNIP